MAGAQSSSMTSQLSFTCPECSKSRFKTIRAIRSHFIAENHDPYCRKCNIAFQNGFSFLMHFWEHQRHCPAPITPNVNIASIDSSPLPAQALQPIDSVDSRGATKYGILGDIFQRLQAASHSLTRLQVQRYFLGIEYPQKNRRGRSSVIEDEEFIWAPEWTYPSSNLKRWAIAVDCEMVGVEDGQTLAFLSAIDFFTGEALINNFVMPNRLVKDWRTRYSGMTQALMDQAWSKGEAFWDWQAARQRLLHFMDQGTILIGHALNNDLDVLGIIHTNIVDSSILTSEAVLSPKDSSAPLERLWALKSLAKDSLDRNIQCGKSGHSALEDVYATRDVVFVCISNPNQLQAWGKMTRMYWEQQRQS